MSLGLSSIEFLLILPVVVLIYYLLPAEHSIRPVFLLLCNIFFYASFGYRYVALVVIEALIIWFFGRQIDKLADNRKKRVLLFIAVTILVAVLVCLRGMAIRNTDFIAPLGVSFYTLEAISYLCDVFFKKIEGERSFFRLLLFLSFFPTITSGPIYRYKSFRDSYEHTLIIRSDYRRITSGLIYMIYGYFLKLVIAERIAIPVNNVFESFMDTNYTGMTLICVAILFSLQIYTDFAGYSAIVIGIGEILGYDMPKNFNVPYLAVNIRDFWSRWHISFSEWLRDYIYIPLGGNRKGRNRKFFNIIMTFLISGVWHGFGINYLIWGGSHGFFYIITELSEKYRKKLARFFDIREGTAFHRLLQRVITFGFVTVAWIFFRTKKLEGIAYIIQIFHSTNFGIHTSINQMIDSGFDTVNMLVFVCSILFVFIIDYYCYRKNSSVDILVESQGALAKAILLSILSVIILIFGIYGNQHDASYFLYRDF